MGLEEPRPPSTFALLFGVMAPPILWGFQLFTEYGLVNASCAVGFRPMFHLVTFVFGAVTALAGWVSYRAWQDIRSGRRPDGGIGGRGEFMALAGIMSSVLFLLVILAQGIPPFFFPPCQVAG